MKSNIFIPEKIKVGFQNRDDTYTKKLAYVIYYDQKGKLRKETSWNSWRDNKIESSEFENNPTSGFVLNKKVGDYVSDWNHRQAYVRVYDPRDFEFEITIENLLYILENANSIKGKGLEGEFIYAWDGKDLVLIPINSPDYLEISQFNEILHTNNYIKAKNLIIGATYKTKSNEEWIYMGRFDYWRTKYEYGTTYETRHNYVIKDINKGKYHYFAKEHEYDWEDEPSLQTLQLKSLGDKFIATVSSDCVENYAELFDKLECTTEYSPIDENKAKYIRYTFEEFCEKLNDSLLYCYNSQRKNLRVNKIYNKPNQYYFEDRDNYYTTGRTEGAIEEIYNKLQPMYKNEYLTNGKLYREGV